MKYFFLLLSACLFSGTLYSQAPALTKSDTSEVRFVNSRKFYIYKVNKGETLFSISQKFKIPQEEIHQFNPEINKNGLKAKMKLWIPAYSWLNKKEDEDNSGKAAAVAGKITVTPNKYNIVVVSYFNLPAIYIPGPEEDSSYIPEPLDRTINSNLEFYEGILHAADLLKASGKKISLTVFDTQGDSSRIWKLLNMPAIANADVVITNEDDAVLRKLNNYSKQHNIRLVSTGINTTETVANNDHACSLFPSSLLQCKQMGKACNQLFPGAHCILVKTGLSKENERLAAFGEGWSGNVRKVDYSKAGPEGVVDSLAKTGKNIVFVPTSNEDLVTQLLNGMRNANTEKDYTVIGLPTWLYFETIDPSLLQNAHTWLFNAGYIDSSDIHVNSFRRFFRDKYATEPGESAYQGYDAMLMINESLSGSVADTSGEEKAWNYHGLFTEYHFVPAEGGRCMENSYINILKFDDLVPALVTGIR